MKTPLTVIFVLAMAVPAMAASPTIEITCPAGDFPGYIGCEFLLNGKHYATKLGTGDITHRYTKIVPAGELKFSYKYLGNYGRFGDESPVTPVTLPPEAAEIVPSPVAAPMVKIVNELDEL